MKDGLLDGSPPGIATSFRPGAWMQAAISVERMKHFVPCVKPTKKQNCLVAGWTLIEKKTIAIDIAREKGIVMLCLSSHCTHKL
jgi:hypothetical protein